MSEIKAVLLVPPKGDGDPHGLLREGPCGARPPTAYIPNRGWKWKAGPCAEEYPLRRALVLAWEGKPVPEGMDRAARCWEAVTEESSRGLQAYDRWWCSLVDAFCLAHECRRHGLGTVVLLDAEGREVET